VLRDGFFGELLDSTPELAWCQLHGASQDRPPRSSVRCTNGARWVAVAGTGRIGIRSRGACTMRASRVGGRRSYGRLFQKSNTVRRVQRSSKIGAREALPLTPSHARVYLCKLVFERRISMDRAAGNEADIQAPQPQAGEQARVSGAHEDARWARDAQPAQTAGPGQDRGDGRRQVVGRQGNASERLPRCARIGSGSEIRHLIARGKRQRTSSLDVFLGASPASRSRLGLIVPKHGRRIVDRNLLKRRLREIGRRRILPELDAAGKAIDVLIRARERAYGMDFESLAREIEEAVGGLCSEES
jgi:ribonuclease P protein component